MTFKDFFTKETKPESIEVKAANFDLSNVQLVTGATLSTNNNLTPKELMAFNTHWVYTCNTKNSGTCASIPLKLYYQNKSGRNVLNGVPIKGRSDIVEIVEHPFLDLMKSVNPYMNYTDLASMIFGYMGLIGNSYVYVEKDGSGMPVALYPLLAENVTLKMNDYNGEIISYKYFDNKIYKPEDIIKFSNVQPGSLVNGKGELEACIKAVQRYCYYDLAESQLNKNNSRPDFVASYKTKLTENERQDVEKIWYKKFGIGNKGLGKPLITSEMDIKPIGLPPKDMEYPQGRQAAIKEILACFGVPEALIFLNSANLASSRSATTHYMKYTIFPKMSKYVEKLNEQLLPLYDENLYVDFDKIVEADPVEQSDIIKKYIEVGVMTVDEARVMLNLEPLDTSEKVDTEDTGATDETGN